MKSFYEYVLSHRGANDEKGRFAEAMFLDQAFPKTATDFDELTAYIEMQAHEEMSTNVFDELWDLYATKFHIQDRISGIFKKCNIFEERRLTIASVSKTKYY